MNGNTVLDLLRQTGLDETVREANTSFLTTILHEIVEEPDQLALPVLPLDTNVDQGELAFALERLGLEVAEDDPERREIFEGGFSCRRAHLAAGEPQSLEVLARLASDAILADKPTELAMLLRELPANEVGVPTDLSWPDALEAHSLLAFVLLSRRASGWQDVEAASEEISRLRAIQGEVERTYLDQGQDAQEAAVGLLARYNLARLIDIATTFVISGLPGDALTQLDRHRANVERLLEVQPDSDLLHTTQLVATASKAVIRASIWYSTRTLGARVREFVAGLAAQGAELPLLELWPPQRQALGSGLLDPARRAVVAEMPTSAGKTLVAEFAIVQALALNPASTVAYLVPTRALVNQVARNLRHDLSSLELVVEAAVPVFELDPTESVLLEQRIHVLVTTPEKLDLLLRSGHEVVRDLSLLVADEAHNIGADERGARLELLLATVKRERPQARFLLLTPFVPNADQLASWLSDDAHAAIRVNWRPSERVTAAAYLEKPRLQPHRVKLRTLPSAHNVDLATEIDLDLGPIVGEPGSGKGGVSTALATKLSARGGVLVLLNGRARAEQRAQDVAAGLPRNTDNELLSAVANLASAELGTDATLPELLLRGVAYHHAGLPHELRYLIELLVDRGHVRTVCGTMTLAQGVNFPIASVVIESLQKSVRHRGQRTWRDLTFEEFWNVAGRAGRALRDRVGLVAFPVSERRDIDGIRAYLQRDATAVVSALTDSLRSVTDTAHEFNLRLIADHPAIGMFFQYLTHAVRIAGGRVPTDIEDLLRSSLAFHQVQTHDRALADRLVAFARAYVDEAAGKSRGYLALADSTGFSLSTVDYLFASSRNEHPDFARAEFWQPDRLFGDDLSGLSAAISVLSRVPELSLGRADQGTFNAENVAGIVRDWVRGNSVPTIADRWFANEPDPVERRRDAATYVFSSLVGQIPWGLGALQHVTLGDRTPTPSSHVPFMVFYGVDSEDAARLRMAGVPRALAPGLVQAWRAQRPDATTFSAIRGWLDQVPDAVWAQGIGPNRLLTPRQSRMVWKELAGLPN